MITKTFTPEWKIWIWSNISNGFNKESIFNILLNNGFDYQLIKRELDIEPTNALVWQRQYSQENLNQPYEIELYPFNKSLCDNPRTYRIENNFVEIYHFPELLTYQECDEIISMTDKKIKTSKKSKESKPLIYVLDKKSEICGKINSRLSNLIGSQESLGEDIFIQKIVPGFEYGEKYDFTLPNQDDEIFKLKGHRIWSIQISLNNITEGGHLTFNSIDRSIKPVKGDGVIWKNIYHDGNPNPYTKHTHFQTNDGDKYVLFKYYRQSENMELPQSSNDVQEIEITLNEIK